MKLLILTQAVDRDDPVLGFFHAWIEEFARHAEQVIVVCLREGKHSLPSNVRVLSLGKEMKQSRLRYMIRFYQYVWGLRNEYDGVFIHMNPEYAILGGPLWRLWKKNIVLWYTHKAVNTRLWLAEKLVTKVFTASKESFRLQSKKVIIAGHGIPVGQFVSGAHAPPDDGNIHIAWAGRFSRSKDMKTALKAVQFLTTLGTSFPSVSVSIIGSPITDDDREYYAKEIFPIVLQLNDADARVRVTINPPVSFAAMPAWYHRHHLLLHTSQTGSVDKVVLEALAAGRAVVSAGDALRELETCGFIFFFPAGDYQAGAERIEEIWRSGILKALPCREAIRFVASRHDLSRLLEAIIASCTK